MFKVNNKSTRTTSLLTLNFDLAVIATMLGVSSVVIELRSETKGRPFESGC